MADIVRNKKRKEADCIQKSLGLCARNVRHFPCALGLPYHSYPSVVSNARAFDISSEYSALPGYLDIHAGNLVDQSVCTCAGSYSGVCYVGGSAAVLYIKVTYEDIVCDSADSGDSFDFKGNGV